MADAVDQSPSTSRADEPGTSDKGKGPSLSKSLVKSSGTVSLPRSGSVTMKSKSEKKSPKDMFLSEDEKRAKKKRTLLVQLFVVALVCLLEGIAFTLRHLESSMNKNNSLGAVSLSFVFAGVFLSCLLAPTIIHMIGCRIAVLAGCAGFALFTLANFIPHYIVLPIASVITGLTTGIFLTAHGTYVTVFSVAYADVTGQSAREVLPRFMGLFYMLFISAPLWGNLISSLVLQAAANSVDGFHKTRRCGPNYCPRSSDETYADEKGAHGIRALLGVYLLCALLGLVLAWFYVPDIREQSSLKQRVKESLSKNFDTCRQWKNTLMLALIPLCLYSGVQQVVVYGTFTESYVTCALGMQWVGYVIMTLTMVAMLMSLLLGVCESHVPRPSVFAFGGGLTLGLMIVMLVWEPTSTDKAAIFSLAAIWGISDAIYRAGVSSLIGVLFTDNPEAAFANFRLWQSVGLSLAFAYGKVLCVMVRVLVSLSVLVISTALYMVMEIRLRLSEREAQRAIEGRSLVMPEGATWVPHVSPFHGTNTQWEITEPTLPHESDDENNTEKPKSHKK